MIEIREKSTKFPRDAYHNGYETLKSAALIIIQVVLEAEWPHEMKDVPT